jgi:glycosyltransferase involved in cell wall biosynthesis
VTANCADTLQSVKSYYGLDLKKSCIIPTPIDAAKDMNTWDAKTCDQNSLLFVGRFDKLKGAELVLRSFFELTSSNPRLRLTFVGPDKGIEGPDGKIWLFEEYVERNFPEWFRSRIEFRGQLNHADLMSLRPKHLVTIIAAQIDTMGYMVLEPMSLGCPLVTTAVGGIPEFIKDLHNGILVPSQDVGAMVKACQMILSDRNMATRIGKQAWLDCRNLYNAETVATQSVAAYEQAIVAF